jgi:SAM-dependent methyltransferase
MNGVIDSYAGFVDALEPLLLRDRATRVLDLAAGHGGFCLAAARIARARGDAIEFTASDIKPEYLELGAEEARAEGLPIDFVYQDALDLSNLEPGRYDIIACTQSLHHFSPGMVAVMFEAAARAAGRGVVFVDACRSTLVGLALGSYGLVRCRQPAFAHDSWVSSRRFFLPEELGMLARLGPWGDGVESTWLPPGHCLLRLAR